MGRFDWLGTHVCTSLGERVELFVFQTRTKACDARRLAALGAENLDRQVKEMAEPRNEKKEEKKKKKT